MLLVPLRLGLTDINAAYAETLKVGLCWPVPSRLSSLPTGGLRPRVLAKALAVSVLSVPAL